MNKSIDAFYKNTNVQISCLFKKLRNIFLNNFLVYCHSDVMLCFHEFSGGNSLLSILCWLLLGSIEFEMAATANQPQQTQKYLH